jgi:hypothetical protein
MAWSLEPPKLRVFGPSDVRMLAEFTVKGLLELLFR